jgi:deazaflavin-dependent oxidoreductase (nitroreductase family)
VTVDGGLGDAGLAGDLGSASPSERLAGEDADGGVEHLFATDISGLLTRAGELSLSCEQSLRLYCESPLTIRASGRDAGWYLSGRAGWSARGRGRVRAMLSAEDAALDYCYLTTTGRTTGARARSGSGSDRGRDAVPAGGGDGAQWVRNIRANPAVTVRVGGRRYAARGRPVSPGTDEDATARQLLLEKYQPRYSGDLAGWGRTALPVALDLTPA